MIDSGLIKFYFRYVDQGSNKCCTVCTAVSGRCTADKSCNHAVSMADFLVITFSDFV